MNTKSKMKDRESKRRVSIDEVIAYAKSGADVDDLAEEAECQSTSTNVPKVIVGRSSERASRGRKWQKADVQTARRLKMDMEAPEPKSPRKPA